MNKLIRTILYKLTSKRVNESLIDPMHLYVSEQDVAYFNLSTNSIITVNHNGTTYYFRECPRIAPKDEFFKNAVSDFFESLEKLQTKSESFDQDVPINLDFNSDVSDLFKDYIYKKITDFGFVSTLSRADEISESLSFSIWNEQSCTDLFWKSFSISDRPYGTDDIAIYFLWCMRSASLCFNTMHIAKGEQHSFFSAVRSISSSIVARSLGLDSMVTGCKWCVLNIENQKELFGVLSTNAPGSRGCDIELNANGSLQHELTNLNVLDCISMQKDHGPNNYTVFKDGESCSVCAFDNDNPATFMPLPLVTISLSGCTPLVNKNGMILRPYFDKDLAGRLIALDTARLEKELKPYLNFFQRKAVTQRIALLKKAITKTSAKKPDFLLNINEWNDKTVKEELNNTSVITYLTKAINKKGEQRYADHS